MGLGISRMGLDWKSVGWDGMMGLRIMGWDGIGNQWFVHH